MNRNRDGRKGRVGERRERRKKGRDTTEGGRRDRKAGTVREGSMQFPQLDAQKPHFEHSNTAT